MKMRSVASLCLLASAAFGGSDTRRLLFEDFNLPKTGWGDSLFTHTYVWQGSTYMTDPLGPGMAAPWFPAPLPINQGGDYEGRFATEYISGGTGFGLMPDTPSNYLRSVILDGYVGCGAVSLLTGTAVGGGFVVRHVGPPFGATAFAARVGERSDGSAYLVIERWTQGVAGTPAVFLSPSFPGIATNGCYHLRFGAAGSLLFASLAKVLPAGTGVVETAVDLMSLPGVQDTVLAMNNSLPTGRVGVASSASRGNSVFYDDIHVIVDPAADLAAHVKAPKHIKKDKPATISIRVMNKGPDDAYGVLITDELPAPLVMVTSTPPFTVTSGGLSYALPVLRTGETLDVTLVVRSERNFHGHAINHVEVGSALRDPNERDNIRSQRIDVK